MIMLQLSVWSGPSVRASDEAKARISVIERQEARVTRLPLGEALAMLRRYEVLFKERYAPMVITHRLLGVQEIPDVDLALLNPFEVYAIEETVARMEREED